MLSATVGLGCTERVQVYRTSDVNETFDLIGVLVRKLGTPSLPGGRVPSGVAPPKLVSKRERVATPGAVFARMLRCIPSISESVAGKLVAEFGTLPALQRALATEVPFRRLDLGGGKCMGKARLAHLKEHLLGPPATEC